MSKIQTPPEYHPHRRRSSAVFNRQHEIQRIDGLMNQVEILTDLVTQLIEDRNEQNKAPTRKKPRTTKGSNTSQGVSDKDVQSEEVE